MTKKRFGCVVDFIRMQGPSNMKWIVGLKELGGSSKQVATESMAYILVGRVKTWRGTGLNKSNCPQMHLKKIFDSGMGKYLIQWLGKELQANYHDL